MMNWILFAPVRIEPAELRQFGAVHGGQWIPERRGIAINETVFIDLLDLSTVLSEIEDDQGLWRLPNFAPLSALSMHISTDAAALRIAESLLVAMEREWRAVVLRDDGRPRR
jgi:hypothetical protein